MNRSELVQSIAKDKKSGLDTKASAERALTAVLSSIHSGLKKDKGVQLIGFGNFYVKNRKARNGINPKTGEKIRIKACKAVTFKAGKALKASV